MLGRAGEQGCHEMTTLLYTVYIYIIQLFRVGAEGGWWWERLPTVLLVSLVIHCIASHYYIFFICFGSFYTCFLLPSFSVFSCLFSFSQPYLLSTHVFLFRPLMLSLVIPLFHFTRADFFAELIHNGFLVPSFVISVLGAHVKVVDGERQECMSVVGVEGKVSVLSLLMV